MTPKAYYSIIIMKNDVKSNRGTQRDQHHGTYQERLPPNRQVETEFYHKVQKQPTLGDTSSPKN